MNLEQILDFLHYGEGLKKELRHSWLSDSRQESVAEHSWRMCLMLILINTKIKFDLSKALQMAVLHDINEITVGDVPAFEVERNNKKGIDEKTNMERLRKLYKSKEFDSITDTWKAYEAQDTIEAKIVKAMDKLEVRLQHNEAPIDTWSDIEFPRSLFAADAHCEFQPIIKELNELIKNESREKIKLSGKDLKRIELEAQKAKQLPTKS